MGRPHLKFEGVVPPVSPKSLPIVSLSVCKYWYHTNISISYRNMQLPPTVLVSYIPHFLRTKNTKSIAGMNLFIDT